MNFDQVMTIYRSAVERTATTAKAAIGGVKSRPRSKPSSRRPLRLQALRSSRAGDRLLMRIAGTRQHALPTVQQYFGDIA